MLSFETILEQSFEMKRDKKQNNNSNKKLKTVSVEMKWFC